MGYTEKDLIMMFHTTLRNMGLYTSLSLALLGYSRYYRGKGSMVYNVCFIIFSIIFMGGAMTIGKFLVTDIEKLLPTVPKAEGKETEQSILRKWLDIPKGVIAVEAGILCFGFWTLFEQLTHGR